MCTYLAFSDLLSSINNCYVNVRTKVAVYSIVKRITRNEL